MTLHGRPHLAVLVAGTLAACQTETPSTNCQLAEFTALPGSPLMLLRAARLDRVADWFVLMGAVADGKGAGGSGSSVRWATIELDGQAGPERSAAVPAFTAGPWFSVAGDQTAGDSVLIAFGRPASNGTDLDVFVIAVPSDGSAAPGAPSRVVSIPRAAAAGSAVNLAMQSSTTGMRAALTWVAPTVAAAGAPPRSPAGGAGDVKTLVLAGNGQPVGGEILIETLAGSTCLGFVAGRAEMTVGYLRYETPSTIEPEWSLAELRDSGDTDFTLALPLLSRGPSCPRQAPTAAFAGYAIAWQDAVGSRMGVYDVISNRFNPRLFVTSVEFGGALVQPPLVGLGEVGRDFAVLLARARVNELWRLDLLGVRRPGALALPSVLGDLGQVSALPLGGAIYATYADYTGAPPPSGTPDGGAPSDASPGTGGQRDFVKISCF